MKKITSWETQSVINTKKYLREARWGAVGNGAFAPICVPYELMVNNWGVQWVYSHIRADSDI